MIGPIIDLADNDPRVAIRLLAKALVKLTGRVEMLEDADSWIHVPSKPVKLTTNDVLTETELVGDVPLKLVHNFRAGVESDVDENRVIPSSHTRLAEAALLDYIATLERDHAAMNRLRDMSPFWFPVRKGMDDVMLHGVQNRACGNAVDDPADAILGESDG